METMQKIVIFTITLCFMPLLIAAENPAAPEPEVYSEHDSNSLVDPAHHGPAMEISSTTESNVADKEKYTASPYSNYNSSASPNDTKKAYEKIVASTNCSVPHIPNNGGLLCSYIDEVYYCKPMCNKNYDFAFLRRSRLYEECGHKTAFTWTTQYIGGSRLAECIVSNVLVSGQPSAYFKNETCEDALSNKKKTMEYMKIFIRELANKGIQKDHKEEMDFIACGNL